MFNHTKTSPMSQNMAEKRYGIAPLIDVDNCLPTKPDYTIDSWFVIGRVEEEDVKINYLFHIMAMNLPHPLPSRRKIWQVAYSIMNEADGTYISGDHIYKAADATVDDQHFSLNLPNAEMSGSWDKMKIYLKEDDFEIDITASAIHYPVLTRGTGAFELLNMYVHQFSVPYMETRGKLTLKGKTYDLTGRNARSWFDRQWQNVGDFKNSTEWTWMAIYLDNGEVISVLDTIGKTETPRFMTVMNTDGSLDHSTNIKPFSEAETRSWTSEISKQRYGTQWDLEFMDFDSQLHIEPVIEKQEILSEMNKFSKYEGTAQVSGTFRGQEVTGLATVEIIKI